MDTAAMALLASAGLMAGAVNAIAGGGTLFAFPALISVGLPPVVANASCALAVWPGHAAAIPVSWKQISNARQGLVRRSIVALLGGLAGSGLLLMTGERAFAAVIPWLLLFATLLFALGPQLRRLMAARKLADGPSAPDSLLMLGIEFVFAVYGGYFGAGLGVLLMAGLTLAGHGDFHETAGMKNYLASLTTSIAVIVFIVSGTIAWPQTLCVLVGAIAGGMIGTTVSRRISPNLLRAAVVLVGSILTVHYFGLF
ncbi:MULTISPECIES: sulfite exporter TauE/SafE family protein [unclassified Bradyrhizobium]|uniref:sulfite exporter TauE/SafE family protein n=1 Tax=unclassified Bradyrhizobium TaxID=2631580 RepID=UPI0028EDE837|nr:MULTISPECIES: sulfite exporter TauE/SafE family protein [unclassified Bradyrhizobium]